MTGERLAQLMTDPEMKRMVAKAARRYTKHGYGFPSLATMIQQMITSRIRRGGRLLRHIGENGVRVLARTQGLVLTV